MTPSKTTLKKYGLSVEEWQAILDRQGGVCPICQKVPSTGRWVTDHFHVIGWKKMLPEQRKKYVRGVLCWVCNNRVLTRGITIQKLENAARYLREASTNFPLVEK